MPRLLSNLPPPYEQPVTTTAAGLRAAHPRLSHLRIHHGSWHIPDNLIHNLTFHMIIDITYEQALANATPALRDKITHSVELLRKSESLALKYHADGFIVGFSGGKDSQAVYHLCQLAGVKHVGWFSPTTVDPPQVLRFIHQQYPEVRWHKPEMSIYEHSVRQGCLPTMRIRHCCAAFKENKHPNTVTIVGVRRAESSRRAKRNEVEVSRHKYSGDLDGFELWSEKKIEKMKAKLKNLNQDQFSDHQSESTIRCVGGKDSIIILPILDWSDHDVWTFLNDVVRVPHCSLYDEGRRRIGCIMCPFSSTKSILADAKRWPHVYWKWVEVVKAIREGRTTLRDVASQHGDNQSDTPPQSQQRNMDGGKTTTTDRVNRGVWATEKLLPQPAGGGQESLHTPIATRDPYGYSSSKDYYNRCAAMADYREQLSGSYLHRDVQSKAPFLPSPTGQGYINTPEEMIIDWWISKLPFREWHAKNFLQLRLDFDLETEPEQNNQP